MLTDRLYDNDTEFRKLILRDQSVDLTQVALEIARDGCPDIDFRNTFDWIQARADELTNAVARARSEGDALRELSQCLAESHGIYGDAACYETADSSYLNRIVETTRGIPISLSLLYMAVCL